MRNSQSNNNFTFLIVVLFLGAALRLHFLISAQFSVDSDEAIVGLMAKHILEGKGIPTFYYGQHYMGSLEPISASIMFWFFGMSSITLKLVPFLWFLALICVFFKLCYENLNEQAAKISTLLLAVSPIAFVEWSTKPRGGFIEVIFLATFSLLYSFRYLRNQNIKNAFISSFILGVAWWVNNQIVFFFFGTAIIFIAGLYKSKYRVSSFLKIFLGGLFFFLIGGSPYWIYNLLNKFSSMGMFQFATAKDFYLQLIGVFNISLPMILGAKRFWQSTDVFPLSTTIILTLYALILILNIIILFQRKDIKSCEKLFILLSITTIFTAILIFSSSVYGSLYTAPRYLLPLYIVIFPLVGSAISYFFTGVIRQSIATLVFLVIHILSSYFGGMAIPGEPIVYDGQRVQRDQSDLIKFLILHNIDYVRTNYWIGYKLAFESNEKIKFKIFQNPRDVRIASYENLAPTFKEYLKLPLVLVPAQEKILKKALDTLGVTYKQEIFPGYVLIYDLDLNYFDKLIPVTDSFNITASSNQSSVFNMLDNNESTRWGSGAPQDPSMFVKIHFHHPVVVRFIDLALGKFTSDFPRALAIEAETIDGKIYPLFSNDDVQALSYFFDSQSDAAFLFPSGRFFKGLIIHQTGKDSFFDWSIAELRIYQ